MTISLLRRTQVQSKKKSAGQSKTNSAEVNEVVEMVTLLQYQGFEVGLQSIGWVLGARVVCTPNY